MITLSRNHTNSSNSWKKRLFRSNFVKAALLIALNVVLIAINLSEEHLELISSVSFRPASKLKFFTRNTKSRGLKGDSNTPLKGPAIAILSSNSDEDLTNLCRVLKSLTFLSGDDPNQPTKTPVLVFNEGDFAPFQKEKIIKCTNRPIAFPTVRFNEFPSGFDSEEEWSIYSRWTEVRNKSGRNKWGYHQMTRFWTTGIWEHFALKHFDTIMRIDSDSCFTDFQEEQENLPMLDDNYIYRTYFDGELESIDNSLFLDGLFDFTVDYIEKENIVPSNPDLWESIKITWETTKTLPVVRSNLEICRKSFFQRADVAKWHEALTEEEPFGVLKKRWGDNATRLLTMALFGSQSTVLFTHTPVYDHPCEHSIEAIEKKLEALVQSEENEDEETESASEDPASSLNAESDYDTAESFKTESDWGTPASPENYETESRNEMPASTESFNGETSHELPASSEYYYTESNFGNPALTESFNEETNNELPSTPEENAENEWEIPVTPEENTENGWETLSSTESLNADANNELPLSPEGYFNTETKYDIIASTEGLNSQASNELPPSPESYYDDKSKYDITSSTEDVNTQTSYEPLASAEGFNAHASYELPDVPEDHTQNDWGTLSSTESSNTEDNNELAPSSESYYGVESNYNIPLTEDLKEETSYEQLLGSLEDNSENNQEISPSSESYYGYESKNDFPLIEGLNAETSYGQLLDTLEDNTENNQEIPSTGSLNTEANVELPAAPQENTENNWGISGSPVNFSDTVSDNNIQASTESNTAETMYFTPLSSESYLSTETNIDIPVSLESTNTEVKYDATTTTSSKYDIQSMYALATEFDEELEEFETERKNDVPAGPITYYIDDKHEDTSNYQ